MIPPSSEGLRIGPLPEVTSDGFRGFREYVQPREGDGTTLIRFNLVGSRSSAHANYPTLPRQERVICPEDLRQDAAQDTRP
jgi:hypothetical protein